MMKRLTNVYWASLGLISFIVKISSVLSQNVTRSRYVEDSDLLIDSINGGWRYPHFERDETVFEWYWGTQVFDPYRALENYLDEKTIKFELAQNKLAEAYVNREPTRAKILARLKEFDLIRYEYWFLVNGTFYGMYNPGTYDQSRFIRGVSNQRETIVDPALEYETNYTSIKFLSASPNGKYIAFVMSRKGSDWEEIQLIKTENPPVRLKTKVLWTKFNAGISWNPTEAGFYYNKYKKPVGISPDQAGLETEASEFEGYFFHDLITSGEGKMFIDIQANARLLGANKFINGGTKFIYINDTVGLFIVKGSDINNGKDNVFVKDIHSRSEILGEILPDYPDALKIFVRIIDNIILLITDIDASDRRLIGVAMNDLNTIIPIIPEIKNKLMYQVIIGNQDKMIVKYYVDGVNQLVLYELKSYKLLRTIPTEFGLLNEISLAKDDSQIYYTTYNFLIRQAYYMYDFKTNQTTLTYENGILNFNSSLFTQKATSYTSKDGQNIPVIYFHRKGLQPNRKHPVLIYGYGGFRSFETPRFDPFWAYLVGNMDAVVAVALIRGGSERGEWWYQAGSRLNKQKSYDDMIAAVNFFQTNPETAFGSKRTTFINGISNGGLMVAAVCNQIPDKLAGCLAEVGVHDLIRYPLFTVGYGWYGDYGNANFSKADFDNIYKISPLHNVLPKKGIFRKTYPHLWITTGEYDDRVSKAHSLKLVATMQYLHRYAANPILLNVKWKSGHGLGRPTSKILNDLVNKISFMKLVMKENIFQD